VEEEMKLIALTSVALLAATNAFAGVVAYVAPAAPMEIEQPAQMGGSGMWLIPLLGIALIFLAMNGRKCGRYGCGG